MQQRFILIVIHAVLASFLVFLSGCGTAPSGEQRVPQVRSGPDSPPATAPEAPTHVLREVAFSDIPGWSADRFTEAWPAFMQSCTVLRNRPQWSRVCLLADGVNRGDERAIRAFIEMNLAPFQVVASDGVETGMTTGYYEPLLRGSFKRSARFSTALYGVPRDLVTVDLTAVYPQLQGMRLRGRLDGRHLKPYPSRRELRQSNHLKGYEIVWVDCPVDAFFLQVQGSGRVRIVETGKIIRIAYGEQNGHPYRSIGRYLADKRELLLEEVSAQRIRKWLADNPGRLNEVLDHNPSFVFFRKETLSDPNIGPKGAMGVPLTARRSVAVDPRHIPLGVPLFIDTTEPNRSTPLRQLVMAQDTGGAIRGVLRLDYFWGFGDEAGELAGRMKQPIRVWVLNPKNR